MGEGEIRLKEMPLLFQAGADERGLLPSYSGREGVALDHETSPNHDLHIQPPSQS